jgi:fused signal recognition particle receptor
VVAHQPGGDPAAVAHDAYQSAKARDADVLLIDTAGRQHTQGELMAQLQKVMRVLRKLDPEAPDEVLQVLDAGTGQNALAQLRAFNQAVGVDSICLTKLDGTARGGILFAIAEEFALPVRFLGVGEAVDDLRPFDAGEFVDAILPKDTAR